MEKQIKKLKYHFGEIKKHLRHLLNKHINIHTHINLYRKEKKMTNKKGF